MTTVTVKAKGQKAERRQLNIEIDTVLYDSLAEQAQRQQKSLRGLAVLYLQHGVMVDKGEMVEVEALPHIKQIVRAELDRGLGQLRMELKEDMGAEIRGPVISALSRQVDRLAAMIAKTYKESSTARRLVFPVLVYLIMIIKKVERSQAVDEATQLLEQARGGAARDLVAHDS